MTETYSFEILAEVSKARKAVEDFSSNTQQKLDKVNFNTSVAAIAGGIGLAKEAFSAAGAIFGSMISQASEAQESVRLLNNSMRLTGEFSEYASDRAQRFAENLAKVTVYSDNQIVSSLALARNFGLVNSEARKVVQVAADLAAITGKDLQTAVRELAATYNTFVSRDLKKMVPELEALTKTQLRQGEAIDIIAKRMSGSALDATRSFAGETALLRKEVEKVQESIGTFLIRGLGFWIVKMREAKEATTDFIRSYSAAVKQDYNGIFQTVGDTIRRRIKESEQAFEENRKERKLKEAADRRRTGEEAAEEAKRRLEAFKAGWIDKRKELELQSLSESARINRRYENSEEEVRKAFSLGLIKTKKEELTIIAGLERQKEVELQKLQEKIRNESEAAEAKFDAQRQKAFDDGVKNPIKQIIRFGAELDRDQAIGVGAGLVSAIAKGAKGAEDLISKGIGSALSEALGAGEALTGPFSEIIGILGEGPEKTRSTVSEFAKAIPAMISNLAESLPLLIESLVRDLPPALAKAMPAVAVGFASSLVRNMPQIVRGFAEGLVQAAKDFVQAIIDQITSFGGVFGGSGLFGGGGGQGLLSGSGIPVISQIGDLLGLASGGTIPDSPGLRGDKVLLRADAGETIIDRNLTNRLSSFLDRGGNASSGPTTVVLQIGQSELARVLLDLNRGGFRVA